MVSKDRKAFSLLELVVMLSIVGILLSIAVPRLRFDILGGYKADTVAGKIVTDLRYTRSLAISDAATNNKGYELRFAGLNYSIINQNTSATVASCTIDSDVAVATQGNNTVKFGPLGDVQSGSFKSATVAAQGRTFIITPVVATGIIKCVKK